MKINPITRTGGINPYNQQDLKTKEASQAKGKHKDELLISNEAKQLLDTLNSAEGSAVSEAKLQQLKQQVATGTYYVDTQTLVERLLPFLR